MYYERILMDLEVQRDLLSPTGRCYTRAAGPAAGNIRRLFKWARMNGIPVISTLLRLRRDRPGPLAGRPHCVDGTKGEEKLPGTILARTKRINFGLRNTTDLPENIFEHYQQVIFEKRCTDIFVHPRFERLITELDAGTFVLCGAGIARGIVQAAIGLRKRGFGVVLVTDASIDLGDPLAEMAMSRMETKGVIFRPTDKIVTPALRSRRRRAFRRSPGVRGPQHA